MKRIAGAAALLLLIAGFTFSQPPDPHPNPPAPKVDPTPAGPWIILPTPAPVPTPPPPAPPPKPVDGALTLNADQLLVIEASQPAFCEPSPVGLVSVATEQGPQRIRGKFVGGKGKYETKTFKGPVVFVIEVADGGPSGAVDLIFIKVGAKGHDDVFRQLVNVNNAPIPPPQPPPDDPLAASVAAAWKVDKPTAQAGDPAALAAVYRAVASQVVSGTTIKTNGDLFNVIKTSSALRIGARLPSVRKVLGTELGKFMSTDQNATLSQAQRDAAITQLNRFADILGGLQ